jgi:hypothetical protein
MKNGQIATTLQIQHRSLDFWIRRFLVHRSRLFVGIEYFRENRVLEFPGFDVFGSSCVHEFIVCFAADYYVFKKWNDLTFHGSLL